MPKPQDQTTAYDALSPKRRAFVDAYLANGFNGARAHEEAGYGHAGTTDETRRANGSRLLADANVKAALRERMDELSITAEELAFRYTQQAQNVASEYIDGKGRVDLQGIKDAGLMHLVKKVSYDRSGNVVVEFYDAQHAMGQMARVRKLVGPTGAADDPVHLDVSGMGSVLDRLRERVANLDA